LCRMCGREEETWEHVWEECGRWGARGTWEEYVEEFLGEEGEGEKWILMLESFREKAYGEREGERKRDGGMSERVWMSEWEREGENEGGENEREREREGERVLPMEGRR